MADVCERRGTRTLAAVLSAAAELYLAECCDDDDEFDDSDPLGLDADDDFAADAGAMAVDDGGDFSLSSAGFQASLDELAMKKRWAAKEEALRAQQAADAERGLRRTGVETREKKVDVGFLLLVDV